MPSPHCDPAAWIVAEAWRLELQRVLDRMATDQAAALERVLA